MGAHVLEKMILSLSSQSEHTRSYSGACSLPKALLWGLKQHSCFLRGSRRKFLHTQHNMDHMAQDQNRSAYKRATRDLKMWLFFTPSIEGGSCFLTQPFWDHAYTIPRRDSTEPPTQERHNRRIQLLQSCPSRRRTMRKSARTATNAPSL